MSGVYAVTVWSSYDFLPKLSFVTQTWMGCDQIRAKDLNAATFATLDSLKNGLFADKYLDATRTTLHKTYEENINTNKYWINNMSSNVSLGLPIDFVIDDPARYDNLNNKAINGSCKTISL